MAPSESQKKASNKYNLAHMATIGCKLKKEQASAFKAYCEQQGKTSNMILKEFVLDCIAVCKNTAVDVAQPSPQAPEAPPDGALVLIERGPVSVGRGDMRTMYTAQDTGREYYVEPVISDDEWNDLQRAKATESEDPNELPF